MIGERRREEVSSNTSLAVLPREFQQQLTSGLILECAHNLLHPKYARFLRTLFDYGNQHNHVRSSRTLTWQCSVYDYCGGLGDRIRGVAYALLLAVFSRRRLVVFWEAPTEGQYLHPYMLNWTDEGVFHFLRTSRRGEYKSPLLRPRKQNSLFLIPARIDFLRPHQQNLLLSQPFIGCSYLASSGAWLCS